MDLEHSSAIPYFSCSSFYLVTCTTESPGPSSPFKMAGVLFEDIFDVKDVDPDGKKFHRGILDD